MDVSLAVAVKITFRKREGKAAVPAKVMLFQKKCTAHG
jgi:hypothetical protein